MAFVSVANYTHSNYELDYALKFLRIIMLIATAIFGLPGYIGGVVLAVVALTTNKTFSGKPYLYPLIPLNLKELKRRLIRRQLKSMD